MSVWNYSTLYLCIYPNFWACILAIGDEFVTFICKFPKIYEVHLAVIEHTDTGYCNGDITKSRPLTSPSFLKKDKY